VLRRVMLAVSASDRIRDVMIAAPVTRDVIARFVAGPAQDDALRVTRELLGQGLLVTLDHLGEHTTDPEQAAAAADEYIGLVGRLADEGHARAGRAEVSVKPTAVGLGLKEHGEKTARENITRICTAAAAAGTTVTMDMEDDDLVEPTVRLLHELREEFPDLGCVIQSYLRRSETDCRALAGPGSRVRLCKGAYDAPEQVAFAGKHEIDRSYVRCLRALLAGTGYPMLATHDPRLIEIIQAQAILAGRPADSFEYQMLYGIRPAEQRRLANQGSRVRVYVPYGSDWYGYLTRRLIERPANLTFFLRSLISRR
jgi:proline dehydrogenase